MEIEKENYNTIDILARIKKIIKSEERLLAIDKIMEKVTKDLDKENSLEEGKKEDLKMTIIKAISTRIMEFYPDGINSLLNEESPPEDEVSYLLIFNCTDEFHHKFHHVHQNKVDVLTSITLLNDKSQNNENKSTTRSSAKLKDMKQNILKNMKDSISEEMLDYYQQKIAMTLKYKSLLLNSFEDLDKYEEALINFIFEKQAIINGKKLKERDPTNYISEEIFKDQLGDLPYYEFDYEDFILLFFRIIRYLTHLRIKLELAKGENKIYAKLYGNEIIFDKLATHFRYEMQLKPYAYKYAKYTYEVRKSKIEAETELINDTNLASASLININEEKLLFNESVDKKFPHLQFNQLDLEDALNWPPYAEFEPEKGIKFRRYEKNDYYHDCRKDPEFREEEFSNDFIKLKDEVTVHEADCCSKFRNIDKLRLIHKIIDQLIKFKFLQKNEIFDTIILRKNFTSYENQLSYSNLLWNNLNVFKEESQNNLINLIRNFYGEKIAFYFLWLIFYNKWLIFPAILGIIIAIIAVSAKTLLLSGELKTFKNLKFNYYDVSLFAFSILITLWSITYIKAWKQKEKLYCYFWGMENQEENELQQENFQPDEKIPFLFGQKLQVTSTWKKILKQTISYIAIVTLMLINTSIVYLLFRWKAFKTQNGKDNSMFWPILIASINAVQIKIMRVLDDLIARKLSDWENHEKASQRENALALKLIMFEFINNYFALYYIAFVKPYVYETCMDNNCLKEIEIQLYTVLLINLLFNVIEIAIPQFTMTYRKRKLFQKMKEENSNLDENLLQIKPHSFEHQMISDEMDSLIDEYNDMIISFGYVCFFSVAAPLTPLIIFLITYLEKFIDSYKVFYLSKISVIEGASGIAIYNSVLKTFHFVGMLTNIAVVLFTSPSLLNVAAYHESSLNDNNDFILKFLTLAVIENIILIIIRFFNFNYMPKWYDHLPLIKSMYIRKYYNRETQALPHKANRKNILDKSQSEEDFLSLDDGEIKNQETNQ